MGISFGFLLWLYFVLHGLDHAIEGAKIWWTYTYGQGELLLEINDFFI